MRVALALLLAGASASAPAAAGSLPLTLPGPGSESRERQFCRRWLGLATPGREQVLLEAEQRERALPVDARCRAGRRSGLRHKIDAECRNWSKLMDFEVRMIVDRELEPCVTEARE